MGVKITFITGGARSGKSSFALKEAPPISGQKAYLATAETLDDEMKERVKRHKKERGEDWDTYEEPLRIADALSDLKSRYSVVIIDCLTIWLSNLICNNLDCYKEIADFINVLRNSKLKTQNSKLFLVSNEVGMGIVPDNELARRFRDLAGQLNQKVAEIADEVYLVTAGIPMKIKG
jgi:adenosylcobinamide kinase / adenosylcobinamide-phosphate guanylyltransferase